MLKKFVAIFLIISLLFNIGSNMVMNIWFKVANNSFEQAFCENKDKVEKKCHGSCMMKKINKAPDDKNDVSRFVFLFQEKVSTYVFDELTGRSKNKKYTQIKVRFPYIFNYIFYRNLSIFHPPQY